MAVTKILSRNTGLKAAIEYVLNDSKTDGQALTARLNCRPGHEYEQMMETKEYFGKTGGRQCYHLILSYKPGEITPELALQVATEFAEKYLSNYETVIAVHTDREHIHAHVVFNSVSCVTGKKYHVSTGEYYKQIRGISDELCRKYGLSVILDNDEEPPRAVSYIEWLRQSRGQPT
ncbi:MAG: relaxase/mobilization nuclease domain-containing protein, partial [Oscillibacter sp.]|nr:relaxase/mobilization nuclease domain-containing protein [Oscillibacter sp.]